MKEPKKLMDGAVIYCLVMCTLISVASILLYWHSGTAPDSLAITALSAPWMFEFGATASIKISKNKKSHQETGGESES